MCPRARAARTLSSTAGAKTITVGESAIASPFCGGLVCFILTLVGVSVCGVP
jgi:hypothetical protein